MGVCIRSETAAYGRLPAELHFRLRCYLTPMIFDRKDKSGKMLEIERRGYIIHLSE